MKKLLPYLFVLCFFSSMEAQIDLSIYKENVECNDRDFGKIGINVVATDPPYTYSWSTGATTSLIDGLGIGTYSCTVTDNSGNDTVIVVYVGREDCLMEPSLVITPNGDGIHDVWNITHSEFYPNARIMVFNRVGQKVFEHAGIYEPWNATDLLGKKLPDASYYYVIYHKDSDETTIIKGAVTIVR